LASERILIVEDEKIIGLDLQRRLEKFGYTVVDLVSTGEKAIAVAWETRPDIILMDIMLAGKIDGIEAATRIKENSKIPVIFLTAYADENTLERAKQAEPFGYILKPFKERELYTTIDIALYKHSIDRKLYQQEQWFSAILESAGDGIIATDRNNFIRFMNPVAEILTGWKENDVQNANIKEILKLFDDKTSLPIEIPKVPETRSEFPLFFDSVHIINKQGAKIHIEGSVAQILEPDKNIIGQVFVFQDVTDIQRMSETITYQASHDSLTGLINRDEFFVKLENTLDQVKGSDVKHGFIFLDLDKFHVVNDLCGHVAGDELLRQVTEDIKTVVPEGKTIGRLGADEFGILIDDMSMADAENISLKLLQTVQRTFLWQKSSFKITASVGVVPIDAESKDFYNILAAADDACYLAKQEGGNRIKLYDTTNYQFLKRRGEMKWISHLTAALEENRFVLYSQTILALDPSKGYGDKAEILLRLKDSEGNLVPPSDFIPSAERYNFMPAIDRWVIREVAEYIRRSTEAGLEPGIIYCINISGASIADENLYDYLTGVFEQIGVDPRLLCFEITEGTAIENLSYAISFIKRLKQLGSTFALDDFGNGFSSFAYLKSLPVDFLKIDGSYVKDIVQDPIDHTLVKSVNNIGHAMGMRTIAEFVQSDEILRLLKEMGVDYGQGYSISKPEPLVLPSNLPKEGR